MSEHRCTVAWQRETPGFGYELWETDGSTAGAALFLDINPGSPGAYPAELTVAHMEVPCCTGILRMVLEARRLAESDLPVHDISIGIHGQLIERRQILAEPMLSAGNEPAFPQITGVE